MGKDVQAMLQAFHVMKEMNGGIVIVENGEVVENLPLPIGGSLSEEPLEKLMEQEKALKAALAERGYPHG
ncbi:adenine deaminase C-terminal domain-containing protein, partial [Pseudomonas syringae pv. tagetis]|uniref:adenine deaminase C-terminal domain-containing protein n=1 Tax=Pseudomonas syringae group genomosp. 7 TaxID=251699 RepID=UPI0037703BA5